QVTRPDGSIQTLECRIPAGVTDGSRVRMAGQGEPGRSGGKAGDLYRVVTVRPHARFARDGDDLDVHVDVPLYTALLGGEVHVPTPLGKRLALRIPPETQNGQRFRLSSQGLPRLAREGKGDLYAIVDIQLPTGLSEREKELFGELATLRRPAA
ncbi:MAG: J domain-containing protein, partial [Chloroflexi bacterium]|nr:J domain-containing protein [Chloroflexota bacterium]